MQVRRDGGAIEQVVTASRCTSCARPAVPARDLCPDCWGATQPLRLSGAGEIETCTVVHRPLSGFDAPYAVAHVAMDEGVRLFGPVRDIEPESVRPGLPVRLVPGTDGGPPYWFTPAARP